MNPHKNPMNNDAVFHVLKLNSGDYLRAVLRYAGGLSFQRAAWAIFLARLSITR